MRRNKAQWVILKYFLLLLFSCCHSQDIYEDTILQANRIGDGFGQCLSISGDTVVVGAYLDDSDATGVNGDSSNTRAGDSGGAYVFVRDGTWSQQAYLKASNTGAGDNFGIRVDISGDTIVVGASSEDSNAIGVNGDQHNNDISDSGAAYVFVRNGTIWTQQAYLKASNTRDSDLFGFAVSISGDTIVVGAPGEDSSATGVNGNQGNYDKSDSGAVYVFVRNGTTWTQQAYLKASNTGANDHFGVVVSISGDTIVVGAPYEDSIATGVNGNQESDNSGDSGAAYVFVRDGTTWTQQAYLKASNTEEADAFGTSVSVSGDTIVVGAPYEDSIATGVNGDQRNNGSIDSGAAYVFVRNNGTTWTQQAYLKASNPGKSDGFGFAVSISGDTIVVGATYEDSAATGVNASQNNEGAENAGAAYLYVRDGTTWTQHAYLKASSVQAHSRFGLSAAVQGYIVVGMLDKTVIFGRIIPTTDTTGTTGTTATTGITGTTQTITTGTTGVIETTTTEISDTTVTTGTSGTTLTIITTGTTTAGEIGTTTDEIEESETNDSDNSLIIIISIVLGIVVIAILVLMTILVVRSFRSKNSTEGGPNVSVTIELEDNSIITNVSVESPIGRGNFGEVYKGTWQGITEVALKQLSNSESASLMNEIKLLKGLNHPNIVRYYGIYKSPENVSFVMMEYMSQGDVSTLLRSNKDKYHLVDLLSMCMQAAAGMKYLGEKKIVHRDLAARNLLAANGDAHHKSIVKIADFGLSRATEAGFYQSENKTIPFKWTAPEVIKHGTFSTSSDVWSFGITMWEIFSYGELPYQSMTNKEATDAVAQGYRLPSPSGCPEDVYQVMLSCWKASAEDRPSFEHLFNVLQATWKSEDLPTSITQMPHDSELHESESAHYN